jgi:TolB-like protein
MRFLFVSLLMAASAFAQDTGVPGLATKLAQQMAARQLRSVGVLRFTNTQNYDSQLSAHIVDQLNRAMVTQSQGIEVASRSQSDALLKELRVIDSPEIRANDLQTIATKLAVDALITGTFTVTGQSIALETTLLDGKNAHIIGGDSVKLDRADLEPFLVLRKGPAPGPTLFIPAGTALDVRLVDKVDAEAARNTKTVLATLEANIVVDNVVVAKKGAEVKLQASSADGMELHLTLASIALADQRTVAATSDQVTRVATSSKAKAALGGVLGGGGLSAGSAGQSQQKAGEAAKNSVLSFHLSQDAR